MLFYKDQPKSTYGKPTDMINKVFFRGNHVLLIVSNIFLVILQEAGD